MRHTFRLGATERRRMLSATRPAYYRPCTPNTDLVVGSSSASATSLHYGDFFNVVTIVRVRTHVAPFLLDTCMYVDSCLRAVLVRQKCPQVNKRTVRWAGSGSTMDSTTGFCSPLLHPSLSLRLPSSSLRRSFSSAPSDSQALELSRSQFLLGSSLHRTPLLTISRIPAVVVAAGIFTPTPVPSREPSTVPPELRDHHRR